MQNRQFLVLALWGTVAAAQTTPDVAFMQGMILHHGQALTMARMIPSRTPRADFAQMGQRIILSQTDEIEFMTQWLKEHKAPVPMLEGPDRSMHDMHEMPAHHADSAMHHAMMPGMLTTDELAQLAKLQGSEFEQAFLKSMIRHHQGALQMVRALLGAQGGGRDAIVARFAQDVDADQSAEIARMQTLLQPTK